MFVQLNAKRAMDGTQQIWKQVERLSLSQLESFRAFIATRAYKQENRHPTYDEVAEVKAFLNELLQQETDESKSSFSTDFLQ